MRDKVIAYLRLHPNILNEFWKLMRFMLNIIGVFVPVREKTILIASFGGRKYDDSPRAIYEEIIRRPEFDNWKIVWAFVSPDDFTIPRGRKIKIDTLPFFMALLYSKVWISNSGMDRNIGINRKGTIKVETWHGTPLKKIGMDQNTGNLGNAIPSGDADAETIRCAQSEFDREIFARVFNAKEESFLLVDLPRNDGLLKYEISEIKRIKETLGIPANKKVILYMPTYREYLMDEQHQYILKNPIDISKWKKELGQEYVLLIRAHYAVTRVLNAKESDFIIDTSEYPKVNDLYAISDILISDYSSAFIDYSILDKPMLCFAYDYDEYKEKRGFYVDLKEEFGNNFLSKEDEVINHIKNLDYSNEILNTVRIHKKYAPNAGNATNAVVDTIIKRINCKG